MTYHRSNLNTMSLQSIGTKALGIAAIVLGVVVGVVILSNLFPTYSGAVGNLSTAVSDADWGDATANSLGPVFALLVSLGGMFAIIGLAFAVYSNKKGGA